MSATGATASLDLSVARSRWLAVAWTALVLACFFFSRPYIGVTHDAILYTGQALARGAPDIFHKDIYFRWGSQDQYTLFTPLYGLLIAKLGLAAAHFSLAVAGLALFLGASFLLVRALVPARLQAFAMLFIAVSTGQYGPMRIFHMAEQYVSPRPFVEAATLASLLLLFSGRRIAALVLLLAAGLLHPLMALAGLAFWWIHALLYEGNRPLLFVLILVPLAAAFAGVQPFPQLFEVFDAPWFERVYEIHQLLFITRWNLADWSRLAFDLAVLVMAGRLCSERTRLVLRAAQVTAVAVVAVTLVGADLLRNVFITNIQPWRALWIVHWLALAGLPIVLARMWASPRGMAQLIVGLLVFGFITRGTPTALFASLLAMSLFAAGERVSVSGRLVAAAWAALGIAAFANWAVTDYRLLGTPFIDLNPSDMSDFSPLRALGRPFPIMVAAGAFLYFGVRRGEARMAALAASASLVLVLAFWDVRSDFAKYVEHAQPGEHPFSRIVAPGQQVWWYGRSLRKESSVFMSWVVMKRASYQSVTQHVGQHFNRDTTMELKRRDELVDPVQFQDAVCEMMKLMNPEQPRCEPDLEIVEDVCRDSPELDYLALEINYPGKWTAAWTSPVSMGGRRPRFYLYACKTLAER